MMSDVSSPALQIVASELAQELHDARVTLESFAEQQDLQLLHKCNEHLYRSHGALRVAEIYGAALLAEEMRHVTEYLIRHFEQRRHQEEGLDALLRALVQLPTYLERVASGARDLALVLLPLLNDLRAVRGNALLSEGTLLLLNLSSDQPVHPSGRPSADVGQWARQLRPLFQVGLLGWIKGERIDNHLLLLERIAAKLERLASGQPLFHLWWVVGAVLEALREGGLEGSASVKRLLGQADRDMKRLYELGETRYCDAPPVELLNNLLYYVGRASSRGERVTAVRHSFRLQDLQAVDAQVERERESLSAPSMKLMQTVAGAIKEDLARVKDALDIFVRQGTQDSAELAPQLPVLVKIADTVGVLGLGGLRGQVQAQGAALKHIIEARSGDDDALLSIAAMLIQVEDSLDEQLLGMIQPSGGQAAAAGGDSGAAELRVITEAVLRECIVNLARVKEGIAQSMDRPEATQSLEQIIPLMRGITAGLVMLGKTRVVEVLQGIDAQLELFVHPVSAWPAPAVDRLADAIVAVEYYMETLQAGRSDPWYMLDNAETCLRYLQERQSVAAPSPPLAAARALISELSPTVQVPELTEVLDVESAAAVAPAVMSQPTPAPAVQSAPQAAAVQPPTPVVHSASHPSAPAVVNLPPPLSPGVDPEFLELFIEEAQDEIERLQGLLPRWEDNPQDQDALVGLRRSFHTLKGSGRMVGAQLIGEFSWSLENLLNRVLSQTLSRSPAIMGLLRSAAEAVPALVKQLATGDEPDVDIAALITRAQQLAEGTPKIPPAASESSPTSEKKTAVPAMPASPASLPPDGMAAAPGMDPELHEIYVKETAGHLACIRDFIRATGDALPPHPVSAALHRSCHTLSGTAKTAGATAGITLAEPLNRYVRKLHDHGLGLPAGGLQVLEQICVAMQTVAGRHAQQMHEPVLQAALVGRLQALERAADELIAQLPQQSEAGSDEVQETAIPAEHADAQAVDMSLSAAPEEGASMTPAPVGPEDVGALLSWSHEHLPAASAAATGSDITQTGHGDSNSGAAAKQDNQGEPGRSAAMTAANGPMQQDDDVLMDPDAQDDDYDAEVVAIFTEEATELLESAEQAFGAWRQDRANAALVFELKRVVHTLKGGAGMAGIRTMAGLSHDLETLMGKVESGEMPAGTEVFDALQSGLDELHRMRDDVADGQRCEPAPALMRRLRALCGVVVPPARQATATLPSVDGSHAVPAIPSVGSDQAASAALLQVVPDVGHVQPPQHAASLQTDDAPALTMAAAVSDTASYEDPSPTDQLQTLGDDQSDAVLAVPAVESMVPISQPCVPAVSAIEVMLAAATARPVLPMPAEQPLVPVMKDSEPSASADALGAVVDPVVAVQFLPELLDVRSLPSSEEASASPQEAAWEHSDDSGESIVLSGMEEDDQGDVSLSFEDTQYIEMDVFGFPDDIQAGESITLGGEGDEEAASEMSEDTSAAVTPSQDDESAVAGAVPVMEAVATVSTLSGDVKISSTAAPPVAEAVDDPAAGIDPVVVPLQSVVSQAGIAGTVPSEADVDDAALTVPAKVDAEPMLAESVMAVESPPADTLPPVVDATSVVSGAGYQHVDAADDLSPELTLTRFDTSGDEQITPIRLPLTQAGAAVPSVPPQARTEAVQSLSPSLGALHDAAHAFPLLDDADSLDQPVGSLIEATRGLFSSTPSIQSEAVASRVHPRSNAERILLNATVSEQRDDALLWPAADELAPLSVETGTMLANRQDEAGQDHALAVDGPGHAFAADEIAQIEPVQLQSASRSQLQPDTAATPGTAPMLFQAHWAVPPIQYGAVQFMTQFEGLAGLGMPAPQPVAARPPEPEPQPTTESAAAFDELLEEDPLAGTWTGKLEPFDVIEADFDLERWPAVAAGEASSDARVDDVLAAADASMAIQNEVDILTDEPLIPGDDAVEAGDVADGDAHLGVDSPALDDAVAAQPHDVSESVILEGDDAEDEHTLLSGGPDEYGVLHFHADAVEEIVLSGEMPETSDGAAHAAVVSQAHADDTGDGHEYITLFGDESFIADDQTVLYSPLRLPPASEDAAVQPETTPATVEDGQVFPLTEHAPEAVFPIGQGSELADEQIIAVPEDPGIEVEFGADELGAAAEREAVRVPAADAVATGVHKALDVAAIAPELPPDEAVSVVPPTARAAQAEVAEAVQGAADGDVSPVATDTPAQPVAADGSAPVLPGREQRPTQERQEFTRVEAGLLDSLLNNAGEVSIFRARLEQQVSAIEFNLAELGRTVTRLKEQLRKLEMETEAQILHRHEQEQPERTDFDPLELDRYSTIQQLSRALAESVSDVSSIDGLLENLTREAQNLLLQQSRVVTEMHGGLMRTRMVPFQRHVQRLSRLVRQVGTDTGKQVELVITGASGELDRQVLERMLPPLEHMLRNSIVHGIEQTVQRVQAGKPASGTISVGLHREGSEMVIVLQDDGCGIDVKAVRERARQRGLLKPGRELSDEEALQLILEPGFSTASEVTQHAGRGVGMDVVVNEIKKLGGVLFTESKPGQGARFTIRLPFTLAMTQALIVRSGEELYALPLPAVEGVARIARSKVQEHLTTDEPSFEYGGQRYRVQHLAAFIGGMPSVLPEADVSVPLVLIRAGEHSTALVSDELVGSREMVVKSVGPQMAMVRGIAGATIMGDGRIVIILDMGALVRSGWRSGAAQPQEAPQQRAASVLVVDDSITVRRVTQRLLERNGMRVTTAKDGVDALSVLQEHVPDIILLDIEMPRMDGYELATQVRADERLAHIPIVMITSRVGEKHRARAMQIGVNDYLGKPYQEHQLLNAIEPLVNARLAVA